MTTRGAAEPGVVPETDCECEHRPVGRQIALKDCPYSANC